MARADIATPKVIEEPVFSYPGSMGPLSLAEIKAHSRIDIDDDDAILELYVTAARKAWERLTYSAVGRQTLEVVYDRFPASGRPIELPRATPLVSIVSVKFKDSDAVDNTWDAALYVADTDSVPGRIAPAYGESYPSFTASPLAAVRIRYTAGDVKDEAKMPIAMLAAHFYENREAFVVQDRANVSGAAIDFGIKFFKDLLGSHVHAF